MSDSFPHPSQSSHSAQPTVHLSPFAHYYLRNLLHRYMQRLNYLIVQGRDRRYVDATDLNQLLYRHTPQPQDVEMKMEELEALVKMHQCLKKQAIYHHECRIGIEQQILRLSQLRLGTIFPSMRPTKTPKRIGAAFRIYRQTGMKAPLRHWLTQRLNTEVADFHQSAQAQEIRLLQRRVQTHQTNSHYYEDCLSEIEQRIFWLTGLRVGLILPLSRPTVIPEEPGDAFKSFYEGQMCEGIRYRQDLYGLVQAYPITAKLQAYRVAAALLEAKIPVILTESDQRYGLWVSMRSPSYAVLFRQGTGLLDYVLSLHLFLCKTRESRANLAIQHSSPLYALDRQHQVMHHKKTRLAKKLAPYLKDGQIQPAWVRS